MTKASTILQELRRKIYRKAKTEKRWRFWGLYCHIEKKVRRFVMRRKKLKGFGWERWSKKDIYRKWGLFYDYGIEYIRPKAASAR